MQRGIEQTDSDRMSFHYRQRIFHVFLHKLEQTVQCFSSFFFRFTYDHFTQLEQGLFTSFSVEHMFCTEEADTFCTEFHGMGGIQRRFRIRTYTDLFEFIHQFHQVFVRLILVDINIHQGHTAFIYGTFSTIQTDPVAFFNNDAVFRLEMFGFSMYFNIAATNDTAFTPSAGYERCVRCHTPFSSKDCLCFMHAIHIFRGSFFTNKDYFLPFGGPFYCFSRREYHAAFGTTGTCRKTFGDNRR